MNRTFLVIVGVFLTIAFSLSGLVLIPNWQFQEHQPVRNARDGSQYPAPYYGLALQGRDVYVDQGCAYCHTQQVRPKGYGADIRRNWGNRRTVARDYMYEYPILLGTMRTGPDLANIGARQPARDWHYLHLYNPQITSAGSVMPRYPYLFRTIKAGEMVPAGAIPLPAAFQSEGTHILPTARGEQLVEYLRAQNRTFPLPEAKQP
ncbi:MAG: cbb3-type cytochrome c oxidase subunit II [Acidobacteriota bacterium]|jgi:cytochrome c oxidase cbb3-type subunit 2|nr:cbb3-type cytochrome c oxidase subunit II [Bryobacteraceae bacterium CoA2 C42]MCA2966368.1 cbb3-type cytochrome c oxidase subunit II [Acidobacteriaceae bacterium]